MIRAAGNLAGLVVLTLIAIAVLILVVVEQIVAAL